MYSAGLVGWREHRRPLQEDGRRGSDDVATNPGDDAATNPGDDVATNPGDDVATAASDDVATAARDDVATAARDDVATAASRAAGHGCRSARTAGHAPGWHAGCGDAATPRARADPVATAHRHPVGSRSRGAGDPTALANPGNGRGWRNGAASRGCCTTGSTGASSASAAASLSVSATTRWFVDEPATSSATAPSGRVGERSPSRCVANGDAQRPRPRAASSDDRLARASSAVGRDATIFCCESAGDRHEPANCTGPTELDPGVELDDDDDTCPGCRARARRSARRA